MKGLEGKRIGIAATRRADAILKLVQKNGGTPSVFSIQGEQILNEKTSEQNVSELLTKSFNLLILTTGIGTETLEKAAHRMNRLPEFIQKLENTNLAVRGKKTLNWLKEHSLTASFVAEDGTMEKLLDSLAVVKTGEDNHVFLQAYNQDDLVIKDKLENLGYSVYLSKPYQYKEPDHKILNSLRQHIIDQTLDAVIFTSKTQVQNLFNKDKETKEMVDSFNDKVLAVAVGKVTANQLKQSGISNVFHPTNPKMGVMVIELRNYFTANSTAVDS